MVAISSSVSCRTQTDTDNYEGGSHFTAAPQVSPPRVCYRLVAYPDDIRHGAGSTVLHHDPQVAVFEVAAIVSHHMGAEHTDVKVRGVTVGARLSNKLGFNHLDLVAEIRLELLT